MKNLILLFAIAAVAFTSCKKETIEPVTPEEPVVQDSTVTETSGYSVSFAAIDLPGFNNDLIVVVNFDTLGNLQDAEAAPGTNYENIYLSGNTISGELTKEVDLNEAVTIQLIDANGDVAMSYSGTMINDVYDGGQNHLSFNQTNVNINDSSLVGGLAHKSYEAVDMEFKYSVVFSIGN